MATVVGKEHGKARYYIAQVSVSHGMPTLQLQAGQLSVDHDLSHLGCLAAVHAQPP